MGMGKRLIEYLRYILECILYVIYPEDTKCLHCNKELENGSILCGKCLDKIKFCKEAYTINLRGKTLICYSATFYSKIVKELIIKFKYKGYFAIGDFFSREMYKNLLQNNIEFDLVTYVPLSPKKNLKRGYNQSKYLAKVISKLSNKAWSETLIKKKDTKDQKTLDKDKRWENLKSCFQFNPRIDVKNRTIVLVDDVITSGATAYYCAEELIKNGAKSVIVLTAARSIM